MPRANSGKENPSSPGSSVAARGNRPRDDRAAVSPWTHNGRTACGPAVAPEPPSVRLPRGGITVTHQGRRDPPRAFTVPFDGWRPEWDGLLKEFCKRGRDGEREAIAAIRKKHPQVSPATIWARILYLDLTTSKRPPYRRSEWSAEDLHLLQSGYSEGRRGASRTIDALVEKHPDWSRSVVSRKAKSFGLSRPRENEYQPWSADEVSELLSCEGFQMKSIEERMTRTRDSVTSRLISLDRGAEFLAGFKTGDVMRLFRVQKATVRRLKRLGLLVSERGRITEKSVRLLCREHPEQIPFETLTADEQHRLVKDFGYAKPKRARKGGRKKKPPAAIERTRPTDGG